MSAGSPPRRTSPEPLPDVSAPAEPPVPPDVQWRLYLARSASTLAIVSGAMHCLLAVSPAAVRASRLRAWASRLGKCVLRLERMAEMIEQEGER